MGLVCDVIFVYPVFGVNTQVMSHLIVSGHRHLWASQIPEASSVRCFEDFIHLTTYRIIIYLYFLGKQLQTQNSGY